MSKRLKNDAVGLSAHEILLQRSLQGSNYTFPVLRHVPEWLRFEYDPSSRPGTIILGFSARGNWLWEYCVPPRDEPIFSHLVLAARPFDSSIPSALRVPVVRLSAPSMLRISALTELRLPQTIIDYDERAVIWCVEAEPGSDQHVSQLSLLVMDGFGTLLRGRFVSADSLQVTDFNVYSQGNQYCFAINLASQLSIITVGTAKPNWIACDWWKISSPFEIKNQGNKINGRAPLVTTFTLDAERFLVEHLRRQLQKRLAAIPWSLEALGSGEFCLLDYALEFVRFLNCQSFEFVTVAKVGMKEEQCFIALVGQLTCINHKIVSMFKCKAREDMTVKQSCADLTKLRRRGFRNGLGRALSNEAVITGRSLSSLDNPVYPWKLALKRLD